MNDAPRKGPRIRWLSLAEIVGVAALVVAGLGYWDSHRERVQEDRARLEADRDRAQAAKAHDAETKANALGLAFLMTGAPDSAGDRLRLTSVHPEQVIQTQTLRFPSVIRPDGVETTGNPRIDVRWIEEPTRKLKRKSPQGTIPVAVLTTFIEGGQTKTDRAVYMVGYSLHRRLLGGAQVELEGLSLARRDVPGDLQAAADQTWVRMLLTGR
jgi:hypothetical protein